MATREDVLIRFGGDAKGVNATLASIRTSVSGLGSMLAGLGVGVGIAGVTSAIKDTLSWADDLVETADRVGLTTEAVQALRLEAELFGVSTEEVDSALTKFSINLGKARQGTGDLFKVMQQYNKTISGSDVEAIKAYIGLLQNASNAAEQNRIAVAGFGKAGAKMAQAIAESNIPLDQMVAKFQKLGLAAEDKATRKLAALNDELALLGQKIASFGRQGVSGVNDALDTVGLGFSRLSTLFSHWASGDFIDMQQVIAWERQATQSIANVQAAAAGKKTTADPSGVGNASDDFQKYLADRQKAVMTATQLETEIWKQYSIEASAIRKGDEDAALAAQKAQEDAVKALAKAGGKESILASYEKLVGEMQAVPMTVQADIKVTPQSWKDMSLGMKEALTEGGASIVSVPIKPYLLLKGDTLPAMPGDTTITLPEGQGITKEVDQTGANP